MTEPNADSMWHRVVANHRFGRYNWLKEVFSSTGEKLFHRSIQSYRTLEKNGSLYFRTLKIETKDVPSNYIDTEYMISKDGKIYAILIVAKNQNSRVRL